MNTQPYPICPRCGKNPADQLTRSGICCKACLTQEEELCDFCSSPYPTWEYPATDYATGLPYPHAGKLYETASTGGWNACQICFGLIETDQWDKLAERSLHAYITTRGALPADLQDFLLQELKRTHQQFRQHRLGPPKPWTAREKKE